MQKITNNLIIWKRPCGMLAYERYKKVFKDVIYSVPLKRVKRKFPYYSKGKILYKEKEVWEGGNPIYRKPSKSEKIKYNIREFLFGFISQYTIGGDILFKIHCFFWDYFESYRKSNQILNKI